MNPTLSRATGALYRYKKNIHDRIAARHNTPLMPPWEEVPEVARYTWEHEVRVILESLYDPHQEMVDAGRRSTSGYLDIGYGIEAQRKKYQIRWNAMLKELLRDEPG